MRKLPKLDLNVTNRCNFRCAHCAFDSGSKNMKEFSLKKIKKILEETKGLGGKKFDITGGEPLLRKDVGQIIKIGKKLGYKIELITNGSLLTKKKLQLFKKLGLDSLAISLDGSNYKTHARIRRVNKETYKKVLKNIKEAVKQEFIVKINTVAFRSNLNDIPRITDFCIKNKISEHGIYYFTPIGRGKISEELSVEPLTWLNFIKKKLKKYEGKIKLSVELPIIEKGKLNGTIGCIANKAERYHLQILPNGNVYPCVIAASHNKLIANLSNLTIKEIWNDTQLWNKYWKEVSKIFKTCGGYCVNFQNAFKMGDYDTKKFDFICPLRKFSPKEIK